MGQFESRQVPFVTMAESRTGETASIATGGAPVEPLPASLTWSATLDPHDDTHEIEITDEMVRLAIAEIEDEQVYPFGADADAPAPVARAVSKADVIPFPGAGGGERAGRGRR